MKYAWIPVAVLAAALGAGCATKKGFEVPGQAFGCPIGEQKIASMEDLVKFFEKLPNPDKQFAVMPGIAHASFHQKNYAICYHILASFFSQPVPIYKSGH